MKINNINLKRKKTLQRSPLLSLLCGINYLPNLYSCKFFLFSKCQDLNTLLGRKPGYASNSFSKPHLWLKKFLEHLAPVLSLVGHCRLPTLQKFIINGVSEIWIQCVDVTKYITSFHKLHRELLCLSYKSSLNSTKI